MPRFLIERDFPGAGRLPPEELAGIAERARSAAASLAPEVQWLQSYVTEDRIVCVYNASDEALLREHAILAGLPPGRILPVGAVIDPTTGRVPLGAAAGSAGERRVRW
jgi:hypothetical protein